MLGDRVSFVKFLLSIVGLLGDGRGELRAIASIHPILDLQFDRFNDLCCIVLKGQMLCFSITIVDRRALQCLRGSLSIAVVKEGASHDMLCFYASLNQ